MALVLDAPAKLNLHLTVRGRRPDGYHELVTVLQALALHDTLWAERRDAEGIELTLASAVTTGFPVGAGEDNLVHRAATRFLHASGAGGGARLHLHKRIPAGGGLGGGSSDAAAALRLLNELTGRPLTGAHLHALAAGLGADVPFFLAGGTQVATGVGDQLTPLAAPPHLHFVLILPRLGTATEAVYKNLRAHLTGESAAARISPDNVPDGKELALASGFHNDLEAAALELYPELAELRRAIVEAGHANVCMAGSGSTFFVAHQTRVECVEALVSLAALRRRGVDLVQTESGPEQHREPASAPYPGPAGN